MARLMPPTPRFFASIAGPTLCVLMQLSVAGAQSLASLKIGDDATRLSLPGSTATSNNAYKSMTVRKWKLPNGNELSVTASPAGKIVYLESDWDRGSDDPACDLQGLKFGITTLSDLRKRFGSNGFEFQDRGGVMRTNDGIAMFNSYQVGKNIVTFITKVTQKDYEGLQKSGGSEALADIAKLDAISLASKDYAESEWGNMIYDPDYKQVVWK